MNRVLILFSTILIVCLLLSGCAGGKNPPRPLPRAASEGVFVTARDGTRLFVHADGPSGAPLAVYVLSGYTGINHLTEKDVLSLLSGGKYRVVVIHPRGTGYSEGTRGDLRDISVLLDDYATVINADIATNRQVKTVLYGHSVSTAVALSVIPLIKNVAGVILVNPPYRMKPSPGMTPSFGDYLRYAGYMVFAPHVPVVNMAGDPSSIRNPEERKESEERLRDPLLVKYISMSVMTGSKKLIDGMVIAAKKTDCPLLLIYGTDDSIIERSGCDEIYSAWGGTDKIFHVVEHGPHGKRTVLLSSEIIRKWLKKQAD